MCRQRHANPEPSRSRSTASIRPRSARRDDRRRTRRTGARSRPAGSSLRRCASSAGMFARVRQDEIVHHFDGRGTVPQHQRRGAERVEQRARTRSSARPSAPAAAPAGSVASTMKPSVPSEPTMMLREIDGPRRIDEGVEVVAADPAQHLRKAPVDFRRMRGRRARESAR